MTTVQLPVTGSLVEPYELGRHDFAGLATGPPPVSRVAYAATHVVAEPGDSSRVDWDATLAIRRQIWDLGLGVAEAMDTAQRGAGLHAAQARELIRRSATELPSGARITCGITTDDLTGSGHSFDEIRTAYLSQLEFVEEAGVSAVMMASRALCSTARGPDDYAHLYQQVLEESSEQVTIHWLGPMFDPALAGYWGHHDAVEAMQALVAIITDNGTRVEGVKISMLDADLEVEFRRLLPEGVRCYTGDDFNYPDLILGDDQGHSDALLGILDGIAPVASAALHALDAGDVAGYRRLLDPTVPLSRHIFQTPTSSYKTGLAFLAYVCGRQPTFTMLDGEESARSVEHLAEVVRLADAAGLFSDPGLVAARVGTFMESVGVAT